MRGLGVELWELGREASCGKMYVCKMEDVNIVRVLNIWFLMTMGRVGGECLGLEMVLWATNQQLDDAHHR